MKKVNYIFTALVAGILVGCATTTIAAREPSDGTIFFFTAENLKDSCNSVTQDGHIREGQGLAAGDCGGFIRGVNDFHALMVSYEIMSPLWCAPDGVHIFEMVTMVKFWMYKNPTVWELDSTGPEIIIMALSTAYPCPGGNTPDWSAGDKDILW